MQTHIIVHGIGGSTFLNEARGIGAAELILKTKERAFEGIIFSGGRTYGPNAPSEAEGMYRAFRTRAKEISIQVDLEERACDTYMNAIESLKLIRGRVQDSVIFLLSSGWHLPRINKIYQELGVPHRVLVDTDMLIDPALRKAIQSHPTYRIGAMREPLVGLLERRELRHIKRFVTSRRIKG